MLLVACLACAGDAKLVANSTASFTYHESRYEAACVEVKGPESCAAFAATLKAVRRETQTANKVYKIGKLPKSERQRLKSLMADLEKQP